MASKLGDGMGNKHAMIFCYTLAVFLGTSSVILHAQSSHSSFDDQSQKSIHAAVIAAEKVDIAAKLEGVIKTLVARPGKSFSAGQDIAMLESDKFIANKNLADEELQKALLSSLDLTLIEIAEAQLAKVEAGQSATLSLGHRSDFELFRLEMSVKEANANLKSAKLKQQQALLDVAAKRQQADIARLDAESCSVKTPISGVVSEQYKYEGEFVRAGEPIIQIVQLHELLLRVELDLRQYPPFSLADFAVEVTFHDLSIEPLTIYGIELERTGPNNVDSHTYFAYGRLTNQTRTDRNGVEHWLLRPGMAASVRLKNINAVPTAEPYAATLLPRSELVNQN
jgi:biotin carboxyl carrier protein